MPGADQGCFHYPTQIGFTATNLPTKTPMKIPALGRAPRPFSLPGLENCRGSPWVSTSPHSRAHQTWPAQTSLCHLQLLPPPFPLGCRTPGCPGLVCWRARNPSHPLGKEDMRRPIRVQDTWWSLGYLPLPSLVHQVASESARGPPVSARGLSTPSSAKCSRPVLMTGPKSRTARL